MKTDETEKTNSVAAGAKISCVIPAHNEEASIENTLRAVSGVGDSLYEIIVVDDGSTDKTKDIVRLFPNIKLLVNARNLGKSATVAKGIVESGGDFVLLLDADLTGLNSDSIISLTRPIRDGKADVVISMRENTPGWMNALGVDCMSGERILSRSVLLENIESLRQLKSFGLEVFLNKVIIQKKLRVKSVKLANVKNQMKWEKRSFWKGVRDELFMWKDLFKTVSLVQFVRQQRGLKKLLVE